MLDPRRFPSADHAPAALARVLDLAQARLGAPTGDEAARMDLSAADRAEVVRRLAAAS